jgi:PD-(D/E)XK endonuclease
VDPEEVGAGEERTHFCRLRRFSASPVSSATGLYSVFSAIGRTLPVRASRKTMPAGGCSILLPMLTTHQKGAMAETAITLATIKLGIGVSRTIGDERYDLIFDLDERLMRVQCKWASRYGEVVTVRCYSNRRSAEGLVRRIYRENEVGAFAAYCAELDRCFFLPLKIMPPGGTVQLRLNKPRNNQQLGVREAKKYEFAATLRPQHGAIAQLGERRAGSAKVTGSNPVGSIPVGPRPAGMAGVRPPPL